MALWPAPRTVIGEYRRMADHHRFAADELVLMLAFVLGDKPGGVERVPPRSWFGERYWCEGVVSTCRGRLVVHSDGFRAEHARVEALAVPPRLLPADPHRA
jgi:hypothetical protein